MRPNATCFNAGDVRRHLVGGNISVLYSLRGTPWDLDPPGTILFLEDLDELLYHMDRMVQNLRLAGWFKQLAGLVIGGLSDMHDKNPRATLSARHGGADHPDAIGDVDYPVCFGFPAGHIADNRALVLGQKAKLSVTSRRCNAELRNIFLSVQKAVDAFASPTIQIILTPPDPRYLRSILSSARTYCTPQGSRTGWLSERLWSPWSLPSGSPRHHPSSVRYRAWGTRPCCP